ncbi:hypothetical protein ACFLRH_02950 [Actinomycetota bacterium]
MKRTRALVLAAGVLIALVLTALPAAATIDGPCDGTGTWIGESPALEVVASELTEGEVVVIPLEGNVEWTGAIELTPPPTEARPTSGDVKVKVPFPVGTIQVGVWTSTGTSVGNTGIYEYEFPSVLSGFKVTVVGKHWEGTLEQAGPPTCSGEVTLSLAGTNPIGFIGGGLTVVSIMGAYLAIRVKGPTAGGVRK